MFTSEWLKQHLAKSSAPEVSLPRLTEQKEKEIHEFIVMRCKSERWIALHGSMAHKTHRTPGEPDFVILADGGKVILIECKSGTGKLSEDQRDMVYWSNMLGHRIHVVRSIFDAELVLKRNSK